MRTLLRELADFARENGYAAVACPGCGSARSASERCTNCGGSGRLWTSPRGSLSDEGLKRLRQLVGEAKLWERCS